MVYMYLLMKSKLLICHKTIKQVITQHLGITGKNPGSKSSL